MHHSGSRILSIRQQILQRSDAITSEAATSFSTLIRESQDLNEYAFALGALSHYAADNHGHPMAVNRSVPLFYPKLRAEVREAA